MHDTLIIMAAGASSRMRLSLAAAGDAAAGRPQLSKGLLDVGRAGTPLMTYQLYVAWRAGYRRIVIITAPADDRIRRLYGPLDRGNLFHGLEISYAVQHVPPGRTRPWGTADALLQALEQFPSLRSGVFTVGNSDNLYSEQALALLRRTTAPNAWIAYDRDGLHFPPERVAAFSISVTDSAGFLVDMVEKPPVTDLDCFRDTSGVIRVNMNLFKLTGALIGPALEACPVTPGRDEKELPRAVLDMARRHPRSTRALPLREHVPDLTVREDIPAVREYLDTRYPRLNWEA